MMRRTVAMSLSVACLGVSMTIAQPGPAQAASSLQITRVFVNSPGADKGGNGSLNAEYVLIKNTSGHTISLKDYTLRDESHHVYKFGTFSLKRGKTVTVHTGHGKDTSTNRFMNLNWYVWNNSGGDSATLRNSRGSTVDTCAWKTVKSYTNC